jgi:hypothetical protein
VKHGLSLQSVHVPLFGYLAVVGGFLLSMLFIANVFLPATLVDGGSQMHQSKPKILIDSSKKWPERIVYDTSLPTTLPVVPVAQESSTSSCYQREAGKNRKASFPVKICLPTAKKAPRLFCRFVVRR